jgi:glutaredoxin
LVRQANLAARASAKVSAGYMPLDQKHSTAILYRMVMPDHLCPYGLKSKDLLERHGFTVDDHHLSSRAETEAFKSEHGVETTPQTFIGGRRIGGYDALRRHFGQTVKDEGETSYAPVIAIFSVAFLMALAISWQAFASVLNVRTFELFVAVSMCLLAVQKLQDIEKFSTMFLNYDLLARRWVRYGYVYPFAEAVAGLLMIAGALIWIAAPIALFVGTIGAASVFKAVYIDKRELKCACVGGGSNVPLGFVSLTENLMMIGMAIWMPVRMLWLE